MFRLEDVAGSVLPIPPNPVGKRERRSRWVKTRRNGLRYANECSVEWMSLSRRRCASTRQSHSASAVSGADLRGMPEEVALIDKSVGY